MTPPENDIVREVSYVDKRDGSRKSVLADRSWWEVAGAERFSVDSVLPLLPWRADQAA